MKVDVFEGRNLGPDFQHIGAGGNQRAHERRRLAIGMRQGEDDGAAVNRRLTVEAASGTEIRGRIPRDAREDTAGRQPLSQSGRTIERQQKTPQVTRSVACRQILGHGLIESNKANRGYYLRRLKGWSK